MDIFLSTIVTLRTFSYQQLSCFPDGIVSTVQYTTTWVQLGGRHEASVTPLFQTVGI